MKSEWKHRKTRETTKTHGNDEKTMTKEVSRGTVYEQSAHASSRNDAYHTDSIAIQTSRNHVYAKASHSATVRAGHRT